MLQMHRVEASMRDVWGARATRSATVTVVPPNPIAAVITGPNELVEGRPLPEPFSSEFSYSRIGRAIDHSRDEWTNLRDVYDTPGEEMIELHVYDRIGLKSLEPDRHVLTVKEDLRPVPLLEFPALAVRNNLVIINNISYSPDGDEIVVNRVRMRYDSNNDGNISNETVRTMTMMDNQNRIHSRRRM